MQKTKLDKHKWQNILHAENASLREHWWIWITCTQVESIRKHPRFWSFLLLDNYCFYYLIIFLRKRRAGTYLSESMSALFLNQILNEIREQRETNKSWCKENIELESVAGTESGKKENSKHKWSLFTMLKLFLVIFLFTT